MVNSISSSPPTWKVISWLIILTWRLIEILERCGWCFEPGKPVGIISGLKRNSNPSLSCSAHKSFNTGEKEKVWGLLRKNPFLAVSEALKRQVDWKSGKIPDNLKKLYKQASEVSSLSFCSNSTYVHVHKHVCMHLVHSFSLTHPPPFPGTPTHPLLIHFLQRWR